MTTKEKITQALNRVTEEFDIEIVESLIVEYFTEHPSAVINVDFSDRTFDHWCFGRDNNRWMEMKIPALWNDEFIDYLEKSNLYYRVGYSSRIPIRIQYTPIC